jgi:hypothetical protein
MRPYWGDAADNCRKKWHVQWLSKHCLLNLNKAMPKISAGRCFGYNHRAKDKYHHPKNGFDIFGNQRYGAESHDEPEDR